MSSPYRALWPLDYDVAFLNHGSFGACPVYVRDTQAELRDRMEANPVRFLSREAPAMLDEARARVAEFVGCETQDLVFVPNATSGVNAVLRWLRLEPGDELLTTDHTYGACKNALDAVADFNGARVVVAQVPFPIESPEQVVEAVLGAVTPRTKLALLDHVTSPTALIFPIQRLVRELADRGVETLVDGAHAPGMLPLDIATIGPAWYTGNGHKWMCSPKGAGFLYVRRDLQETTLPLVVSHGATRPLDGKTRFEKQFEWAGTLDPTPWLCLPAAIDHLEAMVSGGWEDLRQRNHDLALVAQRMICDALDVAIPAPVEMMGAMASVPLPAPAPGAPADGWGRMEWQAALADRGIEAPIAEWPPESGGLLVRASAQLYNSVDEYERLCDALRELLGR